MGSELGILQNPRGGGKLNNGMAAEGRNRRVLGEIGNLAPLPHLEGKPKPNISQHITRGFGTEPLANAAAKAEADKNNYKQPSEVNKAVVAVDGVEGGKDVGPTQEIEEAHKEFEKLRLEKVVVARKSPSRKTLTSILTARSQAASGAGNKVKDSVRDIDEDDVHDELATVEYVDDIYNFYKLSEEEDRVHDYMGVQPEINVKMRAILVDWLIEVHRKFRLMPESLYLTINVVDRYLSMKSVSRRELQLVGISSMLIACKYEEIWPPEVSDFVAISDNAYAREQVLIMEKAILEKLGWYLTVPTPYVFLLRYTKASDPSDEEMKNMVTFFGEIGLMQYPLIIKYCPSLLAAAAVYAARCTLDKIPLWTATLKRYTGISEDHLKDCAKILVSYHSTAAESKLKAVYRKYMCPEKNAVSLLPPAKILLAKSSA